MTWGACCARLICSRPPAPTSLSNIYRRIWFISTWKCHLFVPAHSFGFILASLSISTINYLCLKQEILYRITMNGWSTIHPKLCRTWEGNKVLVRLDKAEDMLVRVVGTPDGKLYVSSLGYLFLASSRAGKITHLLQNLDILPFFYLSCRLDTVITKQKLSL